MKEPKVSIILPTYNVERFLLQSLESIALQTYKNIEVIIVIDGATDSSYQIAMDFCKKDSRFKVFWQNNAGSGPARNHGIDESTGELIMFVDPDDWCEPDYVENMVRLQQGKDYDLVTTKETAVYFSQKGKQTSLKHFEATPFTLFDEKDIKKYYLTLLSDGLISAPHCKIYKAAIIKNKNLRFPDLRRSQDVVFNYRYYSYVNRLCVSNYSGYMYRVLHKDRALRLKPDYFKTIAFLYSEMQEMHKKWNVAFDNQKACTDFYVSVHALLEANILRHQSIKDIAEYPIIHEIIKNAKPLKIHFKVIRFLVLKKCYFLAALLLYILYYLKNIIQ